MGLFGPLISMITLDFTSAAPPAGQQSTPARRYTKIKEDDRYIVMGIDFEIIWAADYDNAVTFYVRRPAPRPWVTRRPPLHKYSKDMTGISLWASILGLFGPLISIMSAAPTADKGSQAAGDP